MSQIIVKKDNRVIKEYPISNELSFEIQKWTKVFQIEEFRQNILTLEALTKVAKEFLELGKRLILAKQPNADQKKVLAFLREKFSWYEELTDLIFEVAQLSNQKGIETKDLTISIY